MIHRPTTFCVVSEPQTCRFCAVVIHRPANFVQKWSAGLQHFVHYDPPTCNLSCSHDPPACNVLCSHDPPPCSLLCRQWATSLQIFAVIIHRPAAVCAVIFHRPVRLLAKITRLRFTKVLPRQYSGVLALACNRPLALWWSEGGGGWWWLTAEWF